MVPNLNISTAGQLEFFSFTGACRRQGSTLEVNVQSSGSSLLGAQVDGLWLERHDGTGRSREWSRAIRHDAHGERLERHGGREILRGSAGRRHDANGHRPLCAGRQLQGEPTPADSGVARQSWPPALLSTLASGRADGSSWLGYGVGVPVIAGITPDNGVSSSDGITNSPYITLSGSAPSNDIITVYQNGNAIGQTLALLSDTWTFSNMATKLADGVYNFTVGATDPSGFSTPLSYPYQVIVDTHVPSPPALNDISPDTGSSSTDGITDVNTPMFSGWTEPFAVVDLYSNGSPVPFGATEADISGFWSFTVGQPGQVTYPGALSSILSPVFGALQDITSGSGSLLGSVAGALQGVTSGAGSILGSVIGLLQGVTSGSAAGAVLADGTYKVTATAMDIAGTTSPASSPLPDRNCHRYPGAWRARGHRHQHRHGQQRHRGPGNGAKPDHLRDGRNVRAPWWP